MAVYNCHATPDLLPEIRLAFIRAWTGGDLEIMSREMRIEPDLSRRFVRDDVNPDYIVASDTCYWIYEDCLKLRDYLRRRKDAVFIFLTRECFEPDMNLFDYAFTWNPDLICRDRIVHHFSELVSASNREILTNSFTIEQAREILSASPKFCNFIYSHSSEPRDSFFHLLSQYKRVASLGRHLNNVDTRFSRFDSDWYNLSIRMKEGYKFSIAMENASCKGYTTEKIISSLQAHTVPIYWGDPAVAEFINPKAFINCGDYSSFDEVVERVKEVDNDDDLWLDMVTQPWQTEEQRTRLAHDIEKYDAQVRGIFTQDISKAHRRATGTWPGLLQGGFTGVVGIMPPLYIRALRETKRRAGKILPYKAKLAVKRFLHMD